MKALEIIGTVVLMGILGFMVFLDSTTQIFGGWLAFIWTIAATISMGFVLFAVFMDIYKK